MDWHKKLWAWIKILLKMYEKEILEFVNDILDLAFQNLDKTVQDKITPAIRKKIQNKIISEILVGKIEVATIKGKSEITNITQKIIDEIMTEEK